MLSVFVSFLGRIVLEGVLDVLGERELVRVQAWDNTSGVQVDVEAGYDLLHVQLLDCFTLRESVTGLAPVDSLVQYFLEQWLHAWRGFHVLCKRVQVKGPVPVHHSPSLEVVELLELGVDMDVRLGLVSYVRVLSAPMVETQGGILDAAHSLFPHVKQAVHYASRFRYLQGLGLDVKVSHRAMLGKGFSLRASRLLGNRLVWRHSEATLYTT